MDGSSGGAVDGTRQASKRLAPASEVQQLLETCLNHVQKPKEATIPDELAALLDRSDEPAITVSEGTQARGKKNAFVALGRRGRTRTRRCRGALPVGAG